MAGKDLIWKETEIEAASSIDFEAYDLPVPIIKCETPSMKDVENLQPILSARALQQTWKLKYHYQKQTTS